MAECPVTEIEEAWCGHCRKSEANAKPLATGPTIVAQHSGACSFCGDGISAGEDEITYSSEAGGWCHRGCVQPESRAVETRIDL